MTITCTPYIPAVPPTPAVAPTAGQFIVDYNIGWSAGGRSIAEVVGDGGFSFKVNGGAVGVIVGLNDVNSGVGYFELEHSLYFSGGVVQVYEHGAFVANVGGFSGTDTFAIVRTGSTVSYLKNGAALWTSAQSSSGNFFLDTSLYMAGDSVIDAALYTVASTNNISQPSIAQGYGGYTSYGYGAALPATTTAYTTDGHGWSTNNSLPSVAQGFAGTYAQSLNISLPAYAVGGNSQAYSLNVALPATTEAYAGQYAISINNSLPSTTSSVSGLIQPAWAVGEGVSVPATTYATGLTGEIGGQTGINSAYSTAHASNFATGYSDAVSQPTVAYGAQYVEVNYALGTLPALTGASVMTMGTPNAAIGVLPALVGQAFTGAVVNVTLPALTGLSTMDGMVVMRVGVTLPALTGTASCTAGGLVAAAGTLPSLTGLAYGGAVASGTLPSLTGSGVGVTGGTVAAVGTLPSLTGTASMSQGAVLRAYGTLPALTSAPSGTAYLTLPSLVGHAVMNQVVAVTYEAYAINLTTGAVTHYTNYPFDNILRFGNRHYGVASGGIYELSGSLDLTVPIDAHIKTFETNFGDRNFKRIPYIYAAGRSDGGVTIGIAADEGSTHSYDSQWGEAAGNTNHRSVVGRGLRGVYYSLEVSNINGGSLELDALVVPVMPTTRGV